MRAVFFLLALLLTASPALADRIPNVGLYSSSPLPRKVLPNGGYLPEEVPFPAIADPASVRIALERGPNPGYKLEVHGDGSVFYSGDAFVAISGRHRAKISQQAVDRLVAAFRDARFFSLHDSYSGDMSDGELHEISISFDGHTKKVEEIWGLEGGMPEAVDVLEKLVDEIAGTDRWVKGDVHSVAALRAEGWDFSGQDDEHQQMIVNAAWNADSNLFNALLDAGARPNGRYGCEAAAWAAGHSDARALEKLLHQGVLLHWDAPPGDRNLMTCDILNWSLEKGVPEIVSLVLARHPDVNHSSQEEGTPLQYLADSRYNRAVPGSDFAICAEMLLAAGADPYARNAKDRTALDIAIAEKSPVAPALQRWMEQHPQSR